MKSDWKEGQKVVCINSGSHNHITNGKTYVITSINNMFVHVLDNDGRRKNGFNFERFEVIREITNWQKEFEEVN